MSGPSGGAPWRAPRADGPVEAVVHVPGSKSETNRALLLAALADGPGRIRRPLRARDTRLMAAALRLLGVGVDDANPGPDNPPGSDDWLVTPGSLRGPADLDVGNAGTVMRFLLPVAGLTDGDVRLDGDPRVRQRPVGPLVRALRQLGVEVDDGGRGSLPLRIAGRGRVPGGEVTIDASSSSQLVSAVLLAAPRFDKGVRLRHTGPRMPSAPHVAMSVAMLLNRGADLEVDDNVWAIGPGPLSAVDTVIEPDLSSAAPFLAAAAVTAGTVVVPGWPTRSLQPGAALPELLAAFGATFTIDNEGLVLRGPRRLHGADLDLHDVGELAPVLTAVAALATTRSRLRGIAHLRLHETDRLAALTGEIGALGGDLRQTEDGLEVRPASLHAGQFATHDDHRLAMAAAVLGLRVDDVDVDDVATTAKTFPAFASAWESMLRQGATDPMAASGR